MGDLIIDRWTKAVGGQVRPGNNVAYLIDGKNTFAAMFEAILTANSSAHYIYLLGWWLDDLIPLTDQSGSSVYALFRKAALQRVQIRIMLWDQPKKKNTAEIQRVKELPNDCDGILDNNTLNLGAQHQKVLLIRGQRGLTAFCGGIDINEDRIREVKRSPGSPYHDVHCKIQGPAAHDLVDVFVQRWLAHPDHCSIDKKKGELRGLSDRDASGRPPQGKHLVRIGRTFNFVGNGRVCAKERSVSSIMLGAIREAKRFIYVEDQYFVNVDVVPELRKALAKIQHLTVVIPHSRISDLPHVWYMRGVLIGALKKGGFDDKVRVFCRITPDATTFGPHTYVHAKTWIFDDQLAVIGSANFNRRGWSHDSEVIAAIFDKEDSVKDLSFAQKLRRDLWAEHLGVDPNLVSNGTAKSTVELWKNLPPSAKVRPYDPLEDKDTGIADELNWFHEVDPSAADLLPCGDVAAVVRCP